jgi:hypothetical protein
MPAFLPMGTADAPNFEAWATRALDLRRRLDDLPRLNLDSAAAAAIRQRWQLELAELEQRLSGRGG